jgi:hypothetical protein
LLQEKSHDNKGPKSLPEQEFGMYIFIVYKERWFEFLLLSENITLELQEDKLDPKINTDS